jgi:hypothetical protein
VSVLYSADGTANWADRLADWGCLECGQPVEPPAVYWHGHGLLLLHPACAARLGPHLIADAREATLAADPEPRWRRRLIAGVRHRLEREEAVA